MISEKLETYSRKLESIISLAKEDIDQAPDGHLWASTSHGTFQYRQVCEKGKSMRYMPKQEIAKAQKLAQKEYGNKVIEVAAKQKRIIDDLLHNPSYGLLHHSIKDVHSSLPPSKQFLIIPYELSDEEFVSQWKDFEYEGKSLSPGLSCYLTQNGEHVRSKSEVIIANAFAALDIPYRYEMPVYLEDGYMVYPDFIVLNKRTRQEMLWEHFGMMDNPEYCRSALQKINAYGRSECVVGKNLILTFETSECPLDIQTVNALIREFFC